MPNRDLIVIGKDRNMDDRQWQKQLKEINHILYAIDDVSSFCLAHEVIDINRYKTIKASYLIQKYVSDHQDKPFVFLINKN